MQATVHNNDCFVFFQDQSSFLGGDHSGHYRTDNRWIENKVCSMESVVYVYVCEWHVINQCAYILKQYTKPCFMILLSFYSFMGE